MPLHDTTNQIPHGYCQCGCGQKTAIATRNRDDIGWVKGEPRRFVTGHYARTQPEKPLPDVAKRFWAKVNQSGPIHPILNTPCWLWLGSFNVYGYGKTMIGKKHIGAHRLSWLLAFSNIPEGAHVLHHCDTPKCVNPHHLYLGDDADNHRDMILRNRVTGRKLLASDVQDIRRLRSEGNTNTAIGKIYDVSATTISQIVRRKTYKEVD